MNYINGSEIWSCRNQINDRLPGCMRVSKKQRTANSDHCWTTHDTFTIETPTVWLLHANERVMWRGVARGSLLLFNAAASTSLASCPSSNHTQVGDHRLQVPTWDDASISRRRLCACHNCGGLLTLYVKLFQEWTNEWKCSDLKCVWKPTRSQLSLTHHVNKSSRWTE